MKECLKCGNEFEPSKGLVNYCSMKCRQGKEWTEEDKEKKSEAKKILLSEQEIENLIKLFKETQSLKKTSELVGYSPKVVKRYVGYIKPDKEDNYTHVKRFRHKVKERLVEYAGGKCCKCGYDRCMSALEFHHLDPNEKDFGIGERGKTLSFEKMKKEVDKCILVCANCHREIHAGILE